MVFFTRIIPKINSIAIWGLEIIHGGDTALCIEEYLKTEPASIY